MLVILVIVFSASTAFAQVGSDEKRLNKNAIHINLGIFSGNLDYERKIKVKKDHWERDVISSIRISGGYQLLSLFSANSLFPEDRFYTCAQYGWLRGRNNNKLEVFGGLVLFSDQTILPSGNIGYRYEGGTEEPFLFRVGVSFPEAAYLGFGITF